MNTVSKLDAFLAYVDMGDERSINGLFTQLKAKGYAISRSTLIRWKDTEEWEKRVPEVLAGREMEAEAAKVAVAAKQLLEEAGATPDPTTDVLAVWEADDFDAHDKAESTLDKLAGLTSNLSTICSGQATRFSGGTLEFSELIALIKVTGETARATADLYKALNPPAPVQKGKPAADLAPRPDDKAIDFEALRAGFKDPPRLRPQ